MSKQRKTALIILACVFLLSTTGAVYSKLAPHDHEYGEWTVITQPNCTDDGLQERVCVCGEKETEVIPKLGHNYVATPTSATCTEQGFTTYNCSVCGDSYIGDYVAAAGHNIVTLEGVPATCTTEGKTEGKYCSVCNEVILAQTVIPALGHAFDNDADKECNNGCGLVRAVTINGKHYTMAEAEAALRALQPDDIVLVVESATIDVQHTFVAANYTLAPGATLTVAADILAPVGTKLTVGADATIVVTNGAHIDLSNLTRDDFDPSLEANLQIANGAKVTMPAFTLELWEDAYLRQIMEQMVSGSEIGAKLVLGTKVWTKTASGWQHHDHAPADIVVVPGVPATCTTEGTTDGKYCSVCGEVIVAQTTIPALGHAFDNDADKECNNGCGLVRAATINGKHYTMAEVEAALKALQPGDVVVIVESATINVEHTFVAANYTLAPGATLTVEKNIIAPVGTKLTVGQGATIVVANGAHIDLSNLTKDDFTASTQARLEIAADSKVTMPAFTAKLWKDAYLRPIMESMMANSEVGATLVLGTEIWTNTADGWIHEHKFDGEFGTECLNGCGLVRAATINGQHYTKDEAQQALLNLKPDDEVVIFADATIDSVYTFVPANYTLAPNATLTVAADIVAPAGTKLTVGDGATIKVTNGAHIDLSNLTRDDFTPSTQARLEIAADSKVTMPAYTAQLWSDAYLRVVIEEMVADSKTGAQLVLGTQSWTKTASGWAHNHADSDWTLTTEKVEPTCSAYGYEAIYTCTVCQETKGGETIDKLPHTEVIDPAKAPTCLENGRTQGSHCSVCGVPIVVQTIIPATGHEFDDEFDTECNNGCGLTFEVTVNGQHFTQGQAEAALKNIQPNDEVVILTDAVIKEKYTFVPAHYTFGQDIKIIVSADIIAPAGTKLTIDKNCTIEVVTGAHIDLSALTQDNFQANTSARLNIANDSKVTMPAFTAALWEDAYLRAVIEEMLEDSANGAKLVLDEMVWTKTSDGWVHIHEFDDEFDKDCNAGCGYVRAGSINGESFTEAEAEQALLNLKPGDVVTILANATISQEYTFVAANYTLGNNATLVVQANVVAPQGAKLTVAAGSTIVVESGAHIDISKLTQANFTASSAARLEIQSGAKVTMPAFTEALWNDAYLRVMLEQMLENSDIGAQLVLGDTTWEKTATGWEQVKEVAVIINGQEFTEEEAEAALKALQANDKVEILADAIFNVDHTFVAADYTLGEGATLTVQKDIVAAVGTKLTVGKNATIVVESGAHIDISKLTQADFTANPQARLEIANGARVTMPAFTEQLWNDAYLRVMLEQMVAGSDEGAQLVIGDTTWIKKANTWEEVAVVINGETFSKAEAEDALKALQANDKVEILTSATFNIDHDFVAADYTLGQGATLTVQKDIVAAVGTKLTVGKNATIVVESGAHIDISKLTQADFTANPQARLEIANGARVTMPAFTEQLWNDAYLRVMLEQMVAGSDEGAQLVIGDTTWIKKANTWEEVAVVINGETFSKAEAEDALKALQANDKVEILTSATFNIDHDFVAADYTLGQGATLTVQKDIVAATGTKLTVAAGSTIVVESGAHIDISALTKDNFKPSAQSNLEIANGAKVTMPAFVEQLWNDAYFRVMLEQMLAGSDVGAQLVIGETTWIKKANTWEEVAVVINGETFSKAEAEDALKALQANDKVEILTSATFNIDHDFVAADYTLGQGATLTVQKDIVAATGTKLTVAAGSTIVVESGAHIDISALTKDNFKPSAQSNLEIAAGAKVTMPAFVEQLWNDYYFRATLETMLDGSEVGAQLVIGDTTWTKTASGWEEVAVVINGETFSEAEAEAALKALQANDKVEILTSATFNVDHTFVAADYTLGQNATLTVQKDIVAATGTKLTVAAGSTIVVESGAHIDISALTKDNFKPSAQSNLEIAAGAKVTMPAFVEQLWNDAYFRVMLEQMVANSDIGAQLVIGETTWTKTAAGWEEVAVVINGESFSEAEAEDALKALQANDKVEILTSATFNIDHDFVAADYTLGQNATLTVQKDIVAAVGTKLTVAAGSTIVVESGAHIDISNLTKDNFKPSAQSNLEIAAGAKVTMPAFVEQLWNDYYFRATIETMLDGSDVGAQLVIGDTTWAKTASGWEEVAVVINGEIFSEAEAEQALKALQANDKVEILTSATFNIDHDFVAADYTLGQGATLTVQKDIVAAVGTKLTVAAGSTIVVESGAHIDISNLTKDNFKPSAQSNLEIAAGAKVTMPAFVEQLWNDYYFRATIETMLDGSEVGAQLVIGSTVWTLTATGWTNI